MEAAQQALTCLSQANVQKGFPFKEMYVKFNGNLEAGSHTKQLPMCIDIYIKLLIQAKNKLSCIFKEGPIKGTTPNHAFKRKCFLTLSKTNTSKITSVISQPPNSLPSF